MIKLSAHLGYQFTDVPFLERFGLAASAGYRAVEFPVPYEHAPESIAQLLSEHHLELIQIAAPMGAKGEKGIAACSGREEEFKQSIDRAIHYARTLNCKKVHPMAGAQTAGSSAGCDWKAYVSSMRYAAQTFADNEITTLVEVISQATVPGYFMSSFELYDALLDTVPETPIELLFDTYHSQAISGQVLDNFSHWFAHIGHIQIADFPGRHEPGTGSIDFPAFFALVQRLGYSGWVGCEYIPQGSTQSGLHHLAPYLP